jgi:hypothetical protein
MMRVETLPASPSRSRLRHRYSFSARGRQSKAGRQEYSVFDIILNVERRMTNLERRF